MSKLQLSMLCAMAAGAMMPLGAYLATVERIRPQWLENELRHSIIAFGGGVLLAAVAFVLVPQGVNYLPPFWAVAAFGAGGLVFFWIDMMIARRGHSAAQMIAMVSDFIPEAMALGVIFIGDMHTGFLLSALIGLQNLPEGFNAYRELMATNGHSARRVLISFSALSLLGPAAAMIGYYYLKDLPALTGAVMLSAAGGILYLTFQDIAVQAHLKRRWAPSLGAVGGFMLGLIGHLLVH